MKETGETTTTLMIEVVEEGEEEEDQEEGLETATEKGEISTSEDKTISMTTMTDTMTTRRTPEGGAISQGEVQEMTDLATK
jgi:hypothetical protein